MRSKYDRDVIQRLLARKDREGLTYDELSEESGIPSGTLAQWRMRLRREAATDLFEEVVDEEDSESTGFEIVGPRGHRVRVPDDFDEETLRRVVAALPC